MRRFAATWITTAIAAALVLTHFITGVNFSKVAGRLLERIPWNHLDESIMTLLLIIIGLSIDALVARQRTKREIEIQEVRFIVFKATMRSIHELVNDSLNQMQLFRLEGEGLMPEESLISFDDLIQRTAAELKALGDLESTPERETPLGRSIGYERKSRLGSG